MSNHWKLTLKLTFGEIFVIFMISYLYFFDVLKIESSGIIDIFVFSQTIVGLLIQFMFISSTFLAIAFLSHLLEIIKNKYIQRAFLIIVLLLLFYSFFIDPLNIIRISDSILDFGCFNYFWQIYYYEFQAIVTVGFIVSFIQTIKKWRFFIVIVLSSLCMFDLWPLYFNYLMSNIRSHTDRVLYNNISLIVFVIITKIIWIYMFWKMSSKQMIKRTL